MCVCGWQEGRQERTEEVDCGVDSRVRGERAEVGAEVRGRGRQVDRRGEPEGAGGGVAGRDERLIGLREVAVIHRARRTESAPVRRAEHTMHNVHNVHELLSSLCRCAHSTSARFTFYDMYCSTLEWGDGREEERRHSREYRDRDREGRRSRVESMLLLEASLLLQVVSSRSRAREYIPRTSITLE